MNNTAVLLLLLLLLLLLFPVSCTCTATQTSLRSGTLDFQTAHKIILLFSISFLSRYTSHNVARPRVRSNMVTIYGVSVSPRKCSLVQTNERAVGKSECSKYNRYILFVRKVCLQSGLLLTWTYANIERGVNYVTRLTREVQSKNSKLLMETGEAATMRNCQHYNISSLS